LLQFKGEKEMLNIPKKLIVLIGVMILVLALAACASTPEPTQAPAQEAAEEPAATKEPAAEEPAAAEEAAEEAGMEPATIRWWHIQTGENEAAVWQKLADQYMAEHPNVTIEITILENEAFKQRLTTVMQSGDPPDLFQSWGGGVLWEFAEAGLLRDISPEFQGEWSDSFAAKSAVDLYGRNGEQYGVPFRWGAVGLFQNVDLFKQAGLDGSCAATYSDFLANVQTLKEAGITPIALGEGEKWPGHFWWVYLAIREGGKDAFLSAYTREGSFTDEPFVRAGERLAELIALEPFPDGYLGLGYGDQASIFGNGQAAMELMGQWGPAVAAGNSESGKGVENQVWCPFPVVEGGAGTPDDVLGGGDGFAVGKNAPDAAVDFLRFITTAEAQRLGAEVGLTSPPVVKGLEDTIDSEWLQKILDARNKAPYFQLYYDQFLPPAVGAAVNDSVEQLFAGTLDPAGVAEEIEASAAFEMEGISREEAAAEVESEVEEESTEPATIRWWHISTAENEAAFWQQLADEYMAEHPNVTVEITILENEAFKQRLTTVMQSGDPPDLFQSWGGGVLWQFADAGLVRNIAPELEGEWRDSFSAQSALELYGQNGEYYGVPFRWGAVGLFQNVDLFEQAGLDGSCPATYSDLLANAQTLKEAGITPIALGEGEKWPGHFWWVYLAIRSGGQDAFLAAYTREGSFTDEPFVQAGELLQQLVELEPFPDGYLGLGYGDQASIFGNGQAAMELMGQWGPAVASGNSESGKGVENQVWCPFPVVEGGAGTPDDVLGGGDGFAVGINAPDAAVDFLRFLTTADAQRQGAEIGLTSPPVIKGLEDTIEAEWMKQILEARNKAPYFQLYYDQFLPPAVGGAVNDAVEQIFAGVATPEEAAAQIEDAAALELK
jgi:raffinose/stachyose/melibiose transport system substrate-binding protein